ncbi:MAG TPA: phosphoribosylanthranilate isomerase [Dysgonamonadaceae bacterium]|nr:phosphoribosylanthranilate isomerase [Dysgonamonadaceae bacterium]HOV36332.1 phosphoribosylanthranilate isomerase [Dysgonamonadaceae bacterium]HQG07499.1 phosphoribosylanthranilate isomerase [Dysgonamonadaceae bacterium]HQI42594.1 phosphoribosylanthranilate isomerase [Dysgonamonadaceae bacterium]
MIVKVCGMRDAENIREVEALGVDWMGFVFHRTSPRFVGELPDYLPQRAKRVGVFVDETEEQIMETVQLFRLDMVQLHGHETPDFCNRIRSKGLKVIKAINVQNTFSTEEVSFYERACDYFLFDTKTLLPGGSGQKFDWSSLSAYRGTTPFLLSGGISPDDADRVEAFVHERCIGIDLNSRFETSPACKDTHLLQSFIDKIKRK